ncbi:hypothetical protein [Planktothrix tepida]|nr:hypothetical protein [Planktothrix tepida]
MIFVCLCDRIAATCQYPNANQQRLRDRIAAACRHRVATACVLASQC